MADKQTISIEIKVDNSGQCIELLKAAAKRGLEACGMKCADYAAAPIANGGNCPVDTGRLRNSITSRMDGDSAVVIGSPVEYALAQELGGHGRAGHYFLTKACTDHVDEYKSLIEASMKAI